MLGPDHILNLAPGARWLRADLHVHTPASRDMSRECVTATPQDVVRVAVDKGLDLIAITDHNTAAWCDLVADAARGTSLTVFPGVEVSTHQGHVIALFDTGTPATQVEDMLLKLGFERSQFGDLEVASDKGIEETCTVIDKAGGVAIAAHVDGERGFSRLIKVGDERKRAFATPSLWALDIVDPSLRDSYQSGKGSACIRRIACVQSSDSWPKGANQHHLDGIGERHCFLKVDERSLSGIKLALIDPEMRLRLATDKSPTPTDTIVGMWVTGGFLNGQHFRFNENVNCFIGDTGAGKSVALELLRFGLDQQARVAKIQEEVTNLLKEQLCNLSTVHILARKGDTYYVVERTWGIPLSPPVIQRLTSSGLEPVEGKLDMQLFFPLKGFSQSEIIEFARDPDVRLSLTDDLIDYTSEIAAINDLKVSLRSNAANCLTEKSKEANIRQQIASLPTLMEARSEIDRVLNDPRITQHQLWYKEQGLLDGASSQFGDLADGLGITTSSLQLMPTWPDDLDGLPNQDFMGELKTIYREWQEYADALAQGMTEKLRNTTEQLGGLRGRWNARFTAAEQRYRLLLEAVDKDGAGFQALSERRQKIEEQISTLEARRLELDRNVLPRIKSLENEREGQLTELQKNRQAITSKREAKAKELSQKLDNRIRLNVHAHSNNRAFQAALQKIVPGSYLPASDVDLLSKCHPIPLVKLVLAKDLDGLSKKSGVDSTKLGRLWQTIVERHRLEELYELQLTDVEDVIEVMLEVDRGTYKPLEDLAHGQKCMVVLMVALAEGDFPLLVDQPEDALHAPGIEEGIVSTLRFRRGARQCIFATRSANILVSADAEQIIALKADANHGHVASTGALDRYDHRSLVIYHVEGGDEPLRRRLTKYTLRPAP